MARIKMVFANDQEVVVDLSVEGDMVAGMSDQQILALAESLRKNEILGEQHDFENNGYLMNLEVNGLSRQVPVPSPT